MTNDIPRVRTAYGNAQQCLTSDFLMQSERVQLVVQLESCVQLGGREVWTFLRTFPKLFGGISEGSGILCIAAGEIPTA